MTLAPWKKSYDKLRQILRNRDTTLLIKVHIVKTTDFPRVMYGCENWTIKKAECWRIDGFKLWCWRKFLWIPWTARRSNQSILEEISPEYWLEDWCWSWSSSIWPPDAKSWLISKDPDAGKDRGQEEQGTSEDEMVGWCHRLNERKF